VLGRIRLWDRALVVESSFAAWWIEEKKRVAKPLRRDFDTLALLVAWSLWKERNRRVFNRSTLQPIALAQQIVEVANVWSLAGYRALGSLLHPSRLGGDSHLAYFLFLSIFSSCLWPPLLWFLL
jgi:hypothetical protein